MYLGRCEGGVGVFLLVVRFWKIVSAVDSLFPRRSGGRNLSVAISPFAPPGAAVVLDIGGCSMV